MRVLGTTAELKRLSAGSDIHVLDNDEVIFEGVRFLGTTLWTDFMLFAEGEKRAAAMREAQRFMRDFSRIRLGESPFTPEASAALFKRHGAWLERKLAEHRLTLRRGQLQTLQINVGKRCNQACHHCHVEAGPKRTEIMTWAIMERILGWIDATRDHLHLEIHVTDGDETAVSVAMTACLAAATQAWLCGPRVSSWSTSVNRPVCSAKAGYSSKSWLSATAPPWATPARSRASLRFLNRAAWTLAP